MGKGGIGVGSASIILVFSVLCLTVFSLITFVVSGNDKALVDAEASLISGYYGADALAEKILAGIIEADKVPEAVGGVEIFSAQDTSSGAYIVSYMCPINDNKALSVRVAIDEDDFSILTWKMIDTDEWVFDSSLNVWTGD